MSVITRSIDLSTRLLTSAELSRWWHWGMQLVGVLDCWDQRQRTRRQLAKLNDSQLRDIGLSRGDAQLEAYKPFWRA